MTEVRRDAEATTNRRGLAGGALRPWNVLAIALSAISPTTSVFLVYGSGLSLAGSGIVWAFVIGGLIALAMSLCYAELGGLFPSAGGAYTIVRKALGPVFGGATVVLFLLLGLVVTASILTAAATYLNSIASTGLTEGWLALLMMVLVTALSVAKVSPASWVAALMLVLELAVVLVFTGVAFAHGAPGSHPFTAPRIASAGGALGPVGVAGLLGAVVPALFAFNGYDWPLYFAEETSGTRRTLPRAVVLSAAIAVVIEILAVIAATLAIPDLSAAMNADSPLSDIARQVLGPTGATVLIVGVVIAMFDTGLAGNLAYARIYYVAARDGMLPGPLGRFFGYVSPRTQVPVLGFAFLFVGNGLLCVFSSLNELITFTGVVIVTIYLLVAVSALVSRIRTRRAGRPAERAFRMPLWPVPPVIAIGGVVLALAQQSPRDLAIALGLAVVALLGYLAVRKRLPAE
jgi:amino acid transporter